MRDYVADAIAFAMQANPKDRDTWTSMQEHVGRFVADCDVRATGTLRAFQQTPFVYPGNGETVTELAAIDPHAPASLVLFANDLWRWIGGHVSPQQAESFIVAAKVEFVRSQFMAGLFGIYLSNEMPPYSEAARHALATLPEVMRRRPWSDGDAISRTPQPSYWFRQTAAFDFNEWLASTNAEVAAFSSRAPSSNLAPELRADHLLCAIALVWIDEAAHTSEQSFALFAEASDAIAAAKFLTGWDAHEDFLREQGRINAEKRHAGNRAAKMKAIAAYKAGGFPSKDHAAEKIAGNVVSFSFRTVRDWLKGVEPAP